MSDVAAYPGAQPEPKVTARRFIAFTALIFGMFMAILDIQIVASSLAEIQAGLSAAPQEIAWVQTSYLIAEVVMIPLSGFLARALSTRVLFTISAAGFTLASILCATGRSDAAPPCVPTRGPVSVSTPLSESAFPTPPDRAP